MPIFDGLIGLLLLGFLLFCLLDVLTTPRAAIRPLPRAGWAAFVVLFNPVGGAVWLAFGRPRPAKQGGGANGGRLGGTDRPPGADGSMSAPDGSATPTDESAQRNAPSGRAASGPTQGGRPEGGGQRQARRPGVAPDDDPEFLAQLARRISEARDDPDERD